jgi:hypothetical protein
MQSPQHAHPLLDGVLTWLGCLRSAGRAEVSWIALSLALAFGVRTRPVSGTHRHVRRKVFSVYRIEVVFDLEVFTEDVADVSVRKVLAL